MTEEEKLMNEALEESNIGKSTLSTVPKEQGLSLSGQFKGMNIEGLESIPASMVAIPYCRLIQPTSKKTELDNGGEASQGNFLFSDIQKQTTELNFLILRAKHEMIRVDTDGQFVKSDFIGETRLKPRILILGITLDTDKLFILSLSSTSFNSFGKLLAKMKSLHVDKSYRFEIKATGIKQENDKGKYYTVNFALGTELGAEKIQELTKTALEYGMVLDRQEVTEE